MGETFTLPRSSPIPELQTWAQIALQPLGVIVIIAAIPLLIALLPVFGLFWVGAKR